jgi:hypothetical protein
MPKQRTERVSKGQLELAVILNDVQVIDLENTSPKKRHLIA